MSKILVEVAPGVSRWAYEDVVLTGGSEHELDATGDLAEAVAAAVDAGALVLVDGDLSQKAVSSVESQEESEAKYERATAAREPLYAERDRALYGLARRELSDEDLDDNELAEKSSDGSYTTFRATSLYTEAAAAAGSEYHQALVEWDEKMAQAGQEELEN